MSLSSWDLDYRDGLEGENLMASIIETSEVKKDFQWQKTGNVYIEFECWYNNDGKFKPSGIAVTESNYYSLVLPVKELKPVVVSVPTSMLKKLCKESPTVSMDQGANPSKGYLVKVSQIFEAMRNAAA
jgi:hypothetical protein